MKGWLSALGVVLGCSLLASPALAANDHGLAFGLRLGYALPVGETGINTGKNPAAVELRDVVTAMVPLWVDLGYRFDRALYVGAFFQYGLAFVAENESAGCAQGVRCSARDLSFGANLSYHVRPRYRFDPWLGAGLGYEILTVHESGQSLALGTSLRVDESWSLKGLQFLILQAGADYHASPEVAVGPFLNFALGQYSRWSSRETLPGATQEHGGDVNDATHAWITLGFRGQYDL